MPTVRRLRPPAACPDAANARRPVTPVAPEWLGFAGDFAGVRFPCRRASGRHMKFRYQHRFIRMKRLT
jgi:hypothetical protein